MLWLGTGGAFPSSRPRIQQRQLLLFSGLHPFGVCSVGIRSSKALSEFGTLLIRPRWASELDYRVMKELWAYTDNRISVRFEYEWRDESDQWYRTHGNEHWEFDEEGLMRRRDMSANDVPIAESERRCRQLEESA